MIQYHCLLFSNDKICCLTQTFNVVPQKNLKLVIRLGTEIPKTRSGHVWCMKGVIDVILHR